MEANSTTASEGTGQSSLKPVAVSSTSSLDSFFATNFASGTSPIADTGSPAYEHTLDFTMNATSETASEPTDTTTQQYIPHSSAGLSSTSSVISPATTQPMPAGHQLSILNPLMLPSAQVPMLSTAAGNVPIPGTPGNNSIPEFLYQLTKMLTDNNRDIIEWTNGKIEVHSPHKLEAQVLHKYFRHSKFASFQRQLNYFGFRKLAGKGKMAPCSYVNEDSKGDIGSLLLIKRKTTASISLKDKDKLSGKKRDAPTSKSPKIQPTSNDPPLVNPVLAGILYRSKGASSAPAGLLPDTAKLRPSVLSQSNIKPGSSHQALAQTAVGRGIRHGYTAASCGKSVPRQALSTNSKAEAMTSASASSSQSDLASAALNHSSFTFPESTVDSLSQLASNYQNTLTGGHSNDVEVEAEPTPLEQLRSRTTSPSGSHNNYVCFLSRNSSLVDLAMIPGIDEDLQPSTDTNSYGLSFVDFPNPEVHPSSSSVATGNSADEQGESASK